MEVFIKDGMLFVEGEVGGAEVDALEQALASVEIPPGPLAIQMEELELLDGVATARCVSALRELQARAGALLVMAAPQMLAHTLYKTGMLGPRLTLAGPRIEEPTTAN